MPNLCTSSLLAAYTTNVDRLTVESSLYAGNAQCSRPYAIKIRHIVVLPNDDVTIVMTPTCSRIDCMLGRTDIRAKHPAWNI